MYEPSPPAADDEGGLGALLVLLNGAADSFRTVQVTYRTWRHEQRLQEAFRAKVEKQKRRGVYFAAVHSGGAGPAETGETVRIWRDGQRVRPLTGGKGADGRQHVAIRKIAVRLNARRRQEMVIDLVGLSMQPHQIHPVDHAPYFMRQPAPHILAFKLK